MDEKLCDMISLLQNWGDGGLVGTKCTLSQYPKYNNEFLKARHDDRKCIYMHFGEE